MRTIGGVQLRRGLLAFALALAVVSIVVAVSAPEQEDEPDPPTATAPRESAPGAIDVAFRQPVDGEPPVRPVRLGSHVIVRVEAREPGTAELGGLGLIAPVTPGTPATFDVLTQRAGRFDVSLVSVAGERTKLGTLEVNE